MTDTLLHELTDDGIAIITLNRPPVNALSPDYMLALEHLLKQLAQDDGVGALVITSPLKVFSAGLNLKQLVDYDVVQQTAIVDGLGSLFARLYAFPKPVIIAAGGAAIAGGMFFVLTADFTVAGQGARLGLSEVRIGVSFPQSLLEIARDALSKPAFRRILLSGALLDAAEALKLGLVDEVQPVGQVQQRAMAVARDYAALPPKTFAAIKAQMRQPALDVINQALKSNTDPARQGWFTEETIEAIKAVLAPARRRD